MGEQLNARTSAGGQKSNNVLQLCPRKTKTVKYNGRKLHVVLGCNDYFHYSMNKNKKKKFLSLSDDMIHKIQQSEHLLAQFLNYMQKKKVKTLVKEVILHSIHTK